MTKAVVAVAVVLAAGAARAQDPVARPGWTFTPSFGFSGTYDDNVTLSGQTGFEPPNDVSNNDLISVYTPQADLTFLGRRTRLNAGYGGSLLDYRTFSIFNRWDQHAQVGLRRTETQRVSWDVQGSVTLTPSTDALDFDGVPFSHTGARVGQRPRHRRIQADPARLPVDGAAWPAGDLRSGRTASLSPRRRDRSSRTRSIAGG